MTLFVGIINMNFKQWIALLILYVGYLFLGAIVFYYLERGHEIVKRKEDFRLYQDLIERDSRDNATVKVMDCNSFTHPPSAFYVHNEEGVLKSCGLNETTTLALEGYCGRPLTENADIDDVSQEYWNFYKSVFFVLTVVSTVGYGNIHPTMPLTRYLMMIYAVIGLPINGILLTSLASFFSSVFIRAHKKYKRYESRFGLTVDILTYLIPGILVFIFVPATAFYFFEEWTYEESVYFAFVTLTTIGFGDLVAGQQNYKDFNQSAVILYKTFILGWIIFGLGYLIMLLGYLTRAMRSKKVVKLEQKLVEALTHSKLWHGFTKDIGYMRRIMNELYFDKFKPVFRDEHLRFHRKHTYRRSKSLPNITFGMDDEIIFEENQVLNRKRAHSEFIPRKEGLSRVFSESDLHRIDRHATFASASAIRPSELLRQVVDVMEGSIYCSQGDSVGVNVFSDDEILKSETWHSRRSNNFASLYHPSSYEDIFNAKRKRERTLSEIQVPRSIPQTITASTNFGGIDWTWSGPETAKIFDVINEENTRNLVQRNFKNRSPTLSSSFLTGVKWLKPLRKKRRFFSESTDLSDAKVNISRNLENSKISPSELRKTSLYDGNCSKYRPDFSYMTHTAGTGTKGLGLMHGKMNLRKLDKDFNVHKLGSSFRSGDQKFLDETTLGDFLRALTFLHNRVSKRPFPEDDVNKSGNLTIPSHSHSLIDLSPSKESFLRKITPTAAATINRTESMPISNEITDKEPSNLKRLGRFLLKSYSPKSESNCDLTTVHSEK